MKCKPNKRTLKKRIRLVVSLCILFTVLFFGGLIVYLSSYSLKTPAQYITSYVAYSISREMNSEYFLRQHEIKGLEDFNPDTPKSKDWLKSLANYQRPEDFLHQDLKKLEKLEVSQQKNQDLVKEMKNHQNAEKLPDIFNMPLVGSLTIELNSKVIFSSVNDTNPFFAPQNVNKADAKPGLQSNGMSSEVYNLFSDIHTICPLMNSKGEPIGSVTAKVNPNYLMSIYLFLVFIIVAIGLLSLIISNLISKFLTIPVLSPIYHLEKTFAAIASKDFCPSDIKPIQLKRPLREMETLVNSTNLIMQKLNENNKMLCDQKLLLENQNEELEAQNEELIESKKQIEEAQAMLVQSENMASIGQLTAAITHEINTPLGAINSNVQLCDLLMNSLLQNQVIQANDELLDTVTQIKEANSINVFACQRVTEIIKSLKTFSKLDQAEFQEADIVESIKSVLVLTSNLWKKKISIHQEFENIPLVRCFPGLLNQVFMNIIVNAIQSIESKGDIFIRTYSDSDNVYISIKDTGSGIKEENLPKIFDPGFSTKGAGLGMGLGLSICHNIVKKHNGDIKVSSELNKGTEFVIRIPLKQN